MGLGFLVPAFLAGLAGLIVPVLLHLRHRDRDRPLRFPSLMFLEKLPIRTERRQRITDWPLLLLRLLALALVALAFARPVLTNRDSASADGRTKAVVLLVDRSMSMGYGATFTHALDSARAVIGRLGAGDRVAVVAYDDAAEVLQRLTPDKGAAQGALLRLTPQRRGTRLAPALRSARQLLLEAPFAAAEVVVISDLQRASAAGIAGVELPAGVSVRGIGVGPATWSNSAVRSIEAKRVQSGTGASARTLLAVKARVQSHALAAPRVVTAALSVNGRDATTQDATLNKDGETVITFAPVPAPDAAVSLRISLPADSLAADDTLVAVVPRDDALRVGLVAPDDGGETLFLDRALAIGRAPAVELVRLTSAPGSADALARFGVVMYWDVAPTPSAALTEWVNKGGGVVVVAGRRLAARRGELGAFPAARMVGLADRTADRGGTLRDVRLEHPLFTPFRDVPEALRSVRWWRYPRLDAGPDADVLARFDDGVPAMLETRTGEGRTLLLTVPLDNTGGDFPLQPAFLPFVRQLVMHTSGRDAVPLWRATGESWLVPTTVTDAVVTTPGGQLVRPRADSGLAAVPLPDAGIYTAYRERASGEPAALLAVNVTPAESELTPMDTTELLLGVRSAADTATTAEAKAAAAVLSPTELERRQNPWRLLLLAAALVLVGETLLGTRGRRGMARRVVATPMAPNVTATAEERR
ncbi:MAG: BatA domain-containing protein [Gemmatimonadetes bacterium]|nr:BatA domain-containing protein [Gemmatimonadota bacterium]